ncbi:hypothetical protein BDR04DRAFT_1099070 [Suillus decipiens]|nr:hypothetical protein BDR04DRAFT_1099070 [Suillus decipiens]
MPFANLVKICLSRTSLLLLITILGQTVLMSFAWGLIGEILLVDVLALPDNIAGLINIYPTELTLIVTLISTTLAMITSLFFTYAVEKALWHHLSGSITLFKLRTAIALSTQTWVWRQKFLTLSALVCAVYAAFALLHSSWTTLLLPTSISWPVGMYGTELDLGSTAFENQLRTDLNNMQANGAQEPGFETISALTLGNGLTAVDIQGVPASMFSFNGVSYYQSTGGILPAIEEYSGSSNPPGSAVGLAFSGGKVPVNTSFEWGHLRGGLLGNSRSYNVTQQGVTANVTCQPIDSSQNSFTAIPSAVAQGPNITFLTWDAVANCSGNLNSELYFTAGNMSGQMDNATDGFLPVVVCPSPSSTTFNPSKFSVFMSGWYKYSFLPTIVCEVVPYLTTVDILYYDGLIFVDPYGTSPGLTSSPSFPLSQYIATVMAYQAKSNQAMTKNSIGDFLTVYGNNNVSAMYNELEDYWRGITEFASTQLRSGYSASGVPSNMTRSTSGIMNILTYGWQSKAYTYIFLLVVFTLIWGTTVFAAGYGLMQEQDHASDPSFKLSDPIYLIMATFGGRLESELCEGDRKKVDDITVRFEDVPDKAGSVISKRLVPEPLPKTA